MFEDAPGLTREVLGVLSAVLDVPSGLLEDSGDELRFSG